jgi:uncharacterized cupin superfamily protein
VRATHVASRGDDPAGYGWNFSGPYPLEKVRTRHSYEELRENAATSDQFFPNIFSFDGRSTPKEVSIRIMKKFVNGTPFPVPGGKSIEEYLGRTVGVDDFSVAHMKMPAGWSEPPHGTRYHELVIVIAGKLTIVDRDVETVVAAGEVGWIPPTESVLFTNRHDEPCEYWAICTPAFSIERTYS